MVRIQIANQTGTAEALLNDTVAGEILQGDCPVRSWQCRWKMAMRRLR